MSFTNDEVMGLAKVFFELGTDADMAPAWQCLFQKHGFSVDEMYELHKKCHEFIKADPRRPVLSDLYGQITNIIEDNAESLLGEEEVDRDECGNLTERILTEAQLHFVLVDRETYKDLENRANLYRSL